MFKWVGHTALVEGRIHTHTHTQTFRLRNSLVCTRTLMKKENWIRILEK